MKQTKPVNNPDSSERNQEKEIHLSTLAGIFLTPLIFLTLEKNESLLKVPCWLCDMQKYLLTLSRNLHQVANSFITSQAFYKA